MTLIQYASAPKDQEAEELEVNDSGSVELALGVAVAVIILLLISALVYFCCRKKRNALEIKYDIGKKVGLRRLWCCL